MDGGRAAAVMHAFNRNWQTFRQDLAVEIHENDIQFDELHPISGEIAAVCSGSTGSLPYFAEQTVIWCTIAPSAEALRSAVTNLRAWLLPSLGGETHGDGFINPATAQGGLAGEILAVAPEGYFRWRCKTAAFSRVIEKLALSRAITANQPPRVRVRRPSLYELRARFSSALLVGDREAAENTIALLDELQLDSATNTEFMRLRMWHHFREYARIREHPDLDRLQAQPLPLRLQHWLADAFADSAGAESVITEIVEPQAPITIGPEEPSWSDWFGYLKQGNIAAAELFLNEHLRGSAADLSIGELPAFIEEIETLYLNDELRQRHREIIVEGIAEFIDEFAREPEFPRAGFGDLYLALLRLWGLIHGGTSGQEHGHVLLELAGAALQLNRSPDEVLRILEHWWEARPARSQLPFVLDAIELLEREFPDPASAANLWLAAAEVIRRAPEALAPSEKALWKRTGSRLGIDQKAMAEYLPDAPESDEGEVDPLTEAHLRRVAIVCMREHQAREAAEQIIERAGIEIIFVMGSVAGPQTEQARAADVVLFVWMATSHAVFRAFDGFDRKRFCYVQGTGSSSIVRSLERWALNFKS